MSDDLKVALVGAIVGLISTLLPIFLNQAEKRSAEAKQDSVLDIAKKQIEFLNLWLTAEKSMGDDEERNREIQAEISKELEAVKNRVKKSFLDIHVRTYTPWKARGNLARTFLLYTPLDSSSWVFHGIYYICWSVLIAGFLTGIQEGISHQAGGFFFTSIIKALAYATGYVVGYLSSLWPLIPIMVVAYFVATNREKASEKKRLDLQSKLAQPT